MPFIELFILLIFIAVKFGFSFPFIALKYDFSFSQTVILTSVGGILGVLFFALITAIFSKLWDRYYVGSKFEERVDKAYRKIIPERKKKKKVFTRRNKMVIKMRNKYGLIGLVLLTPSLLSIPLGTFITLRYYPKYLKSILFLCAAVILWSVIFTLCFIFF